jgi:hypothetical protein
MPVHDSKYWQDRAEETRAMIGRATDPQVRRVLISIADNYEELAERARQLTDQKRTR